MSVLAPMDSTKVNGRVPSSAWLAGPVCVACCRSTQNTATTRSTSQLRRRRERVELVGSRWSVAGASVTSWRTCSESDGNGCSGYLLGSSRA